MKSNSIIFNRADLIFPVSVYVERNAHYLNLEGRLRSAKKIITPFRFIFTDFEIMRALFFVKRRFYLNNFSKLNDFYKTTSIFTSLIDYNNHFSLTVDSLSNKLLNISGLNIQKPLNHDNNLFAPFYARLINPVNKGFFINSVLNRVINNYYSTDIITKNSKVMSMSALKTFTGNFSQNISKNNF